LSRSPQANGHQVFEVNRPNRQLRHQHGKSDPLDAESAARAVLGGQATALLKSSTSTIEMIRHLKVARDTAVKRGTQTMLTVKAIIVTAPAGLREQLDGITGKMTLIRRLAALWPGKLTSTTASAKASLRAIARRWLALDTEIKAHDCHLEDLTQECAPAMLEAHGIAAGTAAEMLLLVGDNPDRIPSEAAFAKLCGACPIPASSGKPTGTGSTATVTGKRTQPCTVWSLSACAATSRPWTTSGDARPKERARWRSSVASNASWHARYSATCVANRNRLWSLNLTLDL
jgi:transposase